MGSARSGPLISKPGRTRAHKFAKHAGEMTRVLKTRIESHFEDAASVVGELLFCAFYSLQEYVPVRSLARASSEQLGKVMRTHAGYRSKF